MAEGQFLGKRAYYLYVSDVGEVYLILMDQTMGQIAGSGLTLATRINAGNAVRPPRGFKPRGVHWQGELNGRAVRKFIVCNGGSDDALYSSGTSVGLTIDGVAGTTTGRRGEQVRYANLPSGTGAGDAIVTAS